MVFSARTLATPHAEETGGFHGQIAFIGGGNMASAIIGGLIKKGLPASQIHVVEPLAEARTKLFSELGVNALEKPSAALNRIGTVVWAVKPQIFEEAAASTGAYTRAALHLSIAGGIRSQSIANWVQSERVIRAMPNTPALIGKGVAGLFARAGIDRSDRRTAERILASTGDVLWMEREELLDVVTALSGSGPAYVFYFIEAMTEAGVAMGLTTEQAHRIVVGTFTGAAELAAHSVESPAVLRNRVTSKGGTTHAAIARMESDCIKNSIAHAMYAAAHRAEALGCLHLGT